MAERRAFSVSIFARHDGAVLLIHHQRLSAWLPVGGEIDDGETPLEAARRELQEETGLTGRFEVLREAIPGTPEGLLAYEEHLAGSKGRHLNFCFVADVETRDLHPNHEFSDWKWVSEAPSEALTTAPANVRELVLRVLASPRRLAERWVDAFNARDLDRLLSLYADEAVHHSPKLRERQPETLGRITGKPALRAWWADSFDRLIGLSYEPIAITADGERAILEYWRKLPGVADLRVAELFRCEGGVIVESYVYHG